MSISTDDIAHHTRGGIAHRTRGIAHLDTREDDNDTTLSGAHLGVVPVRAQLLLTTRHDTTHRHRRTDDITPPSHHPTCTDLCFDRVPLPNQDFVDVLTIVVLPHMNESLSLTRTGSN